MVLCFVACQLACQVPSPDANDGGGTAVSAAANAERGATDDFDALAVPVGNKPADEAALADANPQITMTSPAKSDGMAAPLILPEMELPAEPVAALRPLLSQGLTTKRKRHCVQIRSLQELSLASRLASEIETQLNLPTWISTADLGPRGTWYRLCVGAELSRREASKKAKLWTSAKGLLHPYMEAVKDGDARFLLQERPAPQQDEATRAQAEALLRAGAAVGKEIYFVTGADDVRYAAMTTSRAPETPEQAEVLFVAPDGGLLSVGGIPQVPCAACERVWADAGARRHIEQVGTIDGVSGQVLLITESSGEEGDLTNILTIVVPETGRLNRHVSFLLSTNTQALHVLGEAEWVQADVDEEMELGLVRFELSLVENRLCAMRITSEIFDFIDAKPMRLDENHIAQLADAQGANDAKNALRLIEGFDTLGDVDTASRLCAAYLANGRSPKVARHCLRRVQELGKKSTLLATKAAGFLAEASSLYRAAVANTLYRNALKLDRDQALRLEAQNCLENPLVEDVNGKRDEHLVRLAEIKSTAHLNLAELPDAVFVTGLRDFGPETPFGALTKSWLTKIQDVLPARYAAIQAALLPPNLGGNGELASSGAEAVMEPNETLRVAPENKDVAVRVEHEVAP